MDQSARQADLPLLLNQYEKVTYDRLKPVCEQNDATVFAKVRLKDAFPVDGSGISHEDYRFCLQAHFDFLVVDRDTKPLFAVEYDGAGHAKPIQALRDRRKNTLCERFDLSLLRINSNYLNRKFRGLDLLNYFIEVWFMHDAFYEAQRKGDVALEEDFDPWLVMSDGRSKKQFPFWLSADAQLALQKLGDKKTIIEPIPSHYVGVDANGTYRCLEWIKLSTDRMAVVSTGMRAQQFPVMLSDLVSQIAVCDLYELVTRILAKKTPAMLEDEFLATLRRYETQYQMCTRGGFGHYEISQRSASASS